MKHVYWVPIYIIIIYLFYLFHLKWDLFNLTIYLLFVWYRARERRDRIDDDYTAIFIKIINKLVEVLFNLIQVMHSSDSSQNMINVIIVIVFIPISLVYIIATEVRIHFLNTRYRHVIEPIIYVSGILTCALLLFIIFISQT